MRYFMHAVLVIVLLVGLFSACGQFEEPLELQRTSDPAMKLLTSASPPLGPTEVVELIAARTEDVGSVTCWINGDFLFIEYATDGGWSLAETHCAVAEFLEDIPHTPSGNPKVGHFPLKKEHEPFTTVHTDSLDMDAWGFSEAEELIIAAHASVQMLSGEGTVLREEGAWGAGDPFFESLPDDPHRIERPDDPSKGPFTRIPEHPGRGNWATYFKVNVKKLKGLLLWNKLDSPHEVTHSRIGPDGVIVGDIEYLPCKHGNGFKPLERTGDHNIPDNYIQYHDLRLGQQGCIEFWYHPDWIDWRVGHIVEFFCYAQPEGYNPSMWMHFNDWQNRLNVGAWGPGFIYGISKSTYITSIPGWSSAEPIHIAVTWDGTAPNMTDRIDLYINGSKVTPSIFKYNGDPTFDDWSSEAVIGLGSRLWPGDWNRHRWEGDDGVFDNIKVWSYPKTDFSDRFEE